MELRKPETADRLYLNGYANAMGRLEANANFAHRFDTLDGQPRRYCVKDNWLRNDRNQDGF